MSDNIKATNAMYLTRSELSILCNWSNDQEEFYFNSSLYGQMTIQGMLNLYHKSIEWFLLTDWMNENKYAEDCWKLQFNIKEGDKI